MATVSGLSSQAAEADGNERTIAVQITNEHVAMAALTFAKAQATKMFARIGVRIQWRGMSQAPPENAILVDMVEQASTNECVGALACAKPYEGIHVRVFYDRLQTKVGKNMVPTLLGYVLVHEITHILQGTNHHADRGVMKKQWDTSDLDRMKSGNLPFTDADVLLIELGLAAR